MKLTLHLFEAGLVSDYDLRLCGFTLLNHQRLLGILVRWHFPVDRLLNFVFVHLLKFFLVSLPLLRKFYFLKCRLIDVFSFSKAGKTINSLLLAHCLNLLTMHLGFFCCYVKSTVVIVSQRSRYNRYRESICCWIVQMIEVTVKVRLHKRDILWVAKH